MNDRSQPGRLHVITDVLLQSRFSHAELGKLVAQAGADTVQYRDKRPLGPAEHLRQVSELLGAVGRTPLVVNDHVETARLCGAWGVHLGHRDLPWSVARERLGLRFRIGATANSLEQALAAESEPVDYLGVGPVFGTSSKRAPAPSLGLDGLRRIVAAVGKPVIAIGGIELDNAEAVLETGAHGIAVLSSVICRDDPGLEVDRLRRRIDSCLGRPILSVARGKER